MKKWRIGVVVILQNFETQTVDCKVVTCPAALNDHDRLRVPLFRAAQFIDINNRFRSPSMEQLQSDVDELLKELSDLQVEKEIVMKRMRSAEDRQVKNWKWIREATKFSGISVNKCSDKSITFHFHPMFNNCSMQTYSITVDFTKEGYEVGQCFLPESINLPDLDKSKPLDRLVWDISDLVDCYVNRHQQITQLEEEFGDNIDRSINYSKDTLKVSLRVRVCDGPHSFMINIHLVYQPDEIKPRQVVFEVDNQNELTSQDADDFETHCTPFYQKPLLEAFLEAF